jgi:hypothetical protein
MGEVGDGEVQLLHVCRGLPERSGRNMGHGHVELQRRLKCEAMLPRDLTRSSLADCEQ